MTYIDYIEIDNFKGLGEKVRVDLGNPSVLIGPNNAGKTTVLQAQQITSDIQLTYSTAQATLTESRTLLQTYRSATRLTCSVQT